ncbi:MAG: hypothetical protein ACK55Z_33020, partial [bacterium]
MSSQIPVHPRTSNGPSPTFGLCGAVVSIYCSRSRGLRLGLHRRLLRRGVWVVPSQAVSTVCFTMYSGGNLEANSVRLSTAQGLSRTRRG